MVVTISEGVLEPTQLCHQQHDDDDDDGDDTVSSEDGLEMSTSYSFTFLVPCPLCLRNRALDCTALHTRTIVRSCPLTLAELEVANTARVFY